MPRNFQRRVQIVSKICTLVFFFGGSRTLASLRHERAAESPALFAWSWRLRPSRLGVVQFRSSFRHREGEKPSTDGDDRVGPRTSTRDCDRRGGASTRASGRACRSRAGIGRGRSRRSAIGVRDRGARRRRGSEKKAPGRTRVGLETLVVDRGEDERARPGRRRDHRPARDDARRLFRRARRIAHRRGRGGCVPSRGDARSRDDRRDRRRVVADDRSPANQPRARAPSPVTPSPPAPPPVPRVRLTLSLPPLPPPRLPPRRLARRRRGRRPRRDARQFAPHGWGWGWRAQRRAPLAPRHPRRSLRGAPRLRRRVVAPRPRVRRPRPREPPRVDRTPVPRLVLGHVHLLGQARAREPQAPQRRVRGVRPRVRGEPAPGRHVPQTTRAGQAPERVGVVVPARPRTRGGGGEREAPPGGRRGDDAEAREADDEGDQQRRGIPRGGRRRTRRVLESSPRGIGVGGGPGRGSDLGVRGGEIGSDRRAGAGLERGGRIPEAPEDARLLGVAADAVGGRGEGRAGGGASDA